MRKCWRADPAERPSFNELASILDRRLQSVAGYVELCMTLPASEMEPEQQDMETVDCSDPEEGKTALLSFPSPLCIYTVHVLNGSLTGEPM